MPAGHRILQVLGAVCKVGNTVNVGLFVCGKFYEIIQFPINIVNFEATQVTIILTIRKKSEVNISTIF